MQNQDISTEDGDRLYSLCKTVVDEGPQVFAPLSEENKNKKYQEEVPVYVSKWMPFKELMMMLQASLQEIGDRWVKPFCRIYLRLHNYKRRSVPSKAVLSSVS